MSESICEISAEQVARYLQEHKEFFINHSELLADLSLPHESGGAVSLLERQVKILRDRSIESRHTLNSLLENARYNDQLFSVTRNLILALLEEDKVSQIASVAQANLCTQPGIDACSLILLEDLGRESPAHTETARELLQRFPSLFRSPARVVSQAITREAAQLLFPHSGLTLRSAALCPITHQGSIIAVLTIGNQSQDYFNDELDTLFLDFIAEVLGSLLRRGN
jgi:uncharacterized protein YigA (DUF484 family)